MSKYRTSFDGLDGGHIIPMLVVCKVHSRRRGVQAHNCMLTSSAPSLKLTTPNGISSVQILNSSTSKNNVIMYLIKAEKEWYIYGFTNAN